MRSFFHGTSAVEFFRYVFMYVCMLERPTDCLSVCLSMRVCLVCWLSVSMPAWLFLLINILPLLSVYVTVFSRRKNQHIACFSSSQLASVCFTRTHVCAYVYTYVYNGNNMTNFHQQATIIMRLLLPLYRYCIA